MSASAQDWLQRIHALPLPPRVKIMNVCGGHERSITMAGLRSALPDNIELVPGPGCPVCICPEEDIFEAIQLALYEDIVLVAYGDMLRVPVNVKRCEARTLEQAKAKGADIRPISSPQEAARIARDNPEKPVIFFAAGFETTTAPTASLLVEGIPDNLFILLSRSSHMARCCYAARIRYPRIRCAGSTGSCRYHHGAGRMGVRG